MSFSLTLTAIIRLGDFIKTWMIIFMDGRDQDPNNCTVTCVKPRFSDLSLLFPDPRCECSASEHVDRAWNDHPASCRRVPWRFNHTQWGEDLVSHPTETIMAPTKCSLSCGVDLPVHRNGVSAAYMLPFSLLCSAHSVMKTVDLNDTVSLLRAGMAPTWCIKSWEDSPMML